MLIKQCFVLNVNSYLKHNRILLTLENNDRLNKSLTFTLKQFYYLSFETLKCNNFYNVLK